MTQEQLAEAIGKTRSLVSYFERTGVINKYTFKEIAEVLHITTEELEKLEDEVLKLKESPTDTSCDTRWFSHRCSCCSQGAAHSDATARCAL